MPDVIYAECLNNPIMLSVVMLSVVMLNVVMLNVVMLSVVMLSVVMLNVVAPKKIFIEWSSAANVIGFDCLMWISNATGLYNKTFSHCNCNVV